jgi:hypothetical protein
LKMVTYPLNLRPAKNRDAPHSRIVPHCGLTGRSGPRQTSGMARKLRLKYPK